MTPHYRRFTKIKHGSLGTRYPEIDGSQALVRTEDGRLHYRIVAHNPTWTTYPLISNEREAAVLAALPNLPVFNAAAGTPVRLSGSNLGGNGIAVG